MQLTVTSEDGVSATQSLAGPFEPARQAERAEQGLRDGLSKLGQTLYQARTVTIDLAQPYFVPNSQLNQLRREAIERLDALRAGQDNRPRRKPALMPPVLYPQTHLTYLDNVYNHLAREFYQQHGVTLIEAAYEAHAEKGEVPVMITKHCLRFAFNLCPKQARGIQG